MINVVARANQEAVGQISWFALKQGIQSHSQPLTKLTITLDLCQRSKTINLRLQILVFPLGNMRGWNPRFNIFQHHVNTSHPLLTSPLSSPFISCLLSKEVSLSLIYSENWFWTISPSQDKLTPNQMQACWSRYQAVTSPWSSLHVHSFHLPKSPLNLASSSTDTVFYFFASIQVLCIDKAFP